MRIKTIVIGRDDFDPAFFPLRSVWPARSCRRSRTIEGDW